MPSIVHADAALETWTGTGTGNATLAGALNVSYRTLPDGTYPYWIRNQDVLEWETGIGTVATGVLTRTTVLSSSNAGALVSFNAGTKHVGVGNIAAFLDPAPLSAKVGCRVEMTGTQVVTSGAPVTDIQWDEVDVWDPRGWHDPSTNPERITPDIPGIYVVKSVVIFPAITTGRIGLDVRKNASTEIAFPLQAAINNAVVLAVADVRLNGTTDYVKVSAFQETGSDANVGSSNGHLAFCTVRWSAPLPTYAGPM